MEPAGEQQSSPWGEVAWAPKQSCNFLKNGWIGESRDSAVGIATGYWLDDRGVEVWVLVGSRISQHFMEPQESIDRWPANGSLAWGGGHGHRNKVAIF
jgi:hypothetical protein